MSISYKAIVGHTARATLPSVETWGTNMNILKDPPRSLFTRQIDKVGQTSEITQMIQESGDRVSDVIQVYARGVNPMVSVSYDNYGNNGGQRSGGISSAGMPAGGGNSGKQSFLPYRVMQNGAFRPPMRDQRELLPLSRLPRVWTTSFTNPSFPDFSKKVMCPSPGTETKGVKTDMLKACVRPTMTYKLETPIRENYEIKRVIKNPIQISASSGFESTGKFNADPGKPIKYIHNPLKPDINLNMNTPNTINIDTSNFNTEKYTHDILHTDAVSNKSQNIYITPIEEIYQTNKEIKDQINISYDAPISGYEKYDYMHKDVELERVIPFHNATTNIGKSIHVNMDHVSERVNSMNRPTPSVTTSIGSNQQRFEGSRDYNLKPTISAGGYNPTYGVPQVFHENMNYNLDNSFKKRVYNMKQERDTSVYDFAEGE